MVVLDFGVADTLRALGYEDVIVGMPKGSVPTYLSDLTSKDSITDVGNLKEVNLETIANLEPDLIIASGRTSSQLEDFKKSHRQFIFQQIRVIIGILFKRTLRN